MVPMSPAKKVRSGTKKICSGTGRWSRLAPVLVVAAAASLPLAARADPIRILFVGNSLTHGKYDPVRTYNAGFGAGTSNVHDDNCLTAASCSAAEAVVTPAPAIGTNESGPFGGIPGVFLQLTQEGTVNLLD